MKFKIYSDVHALGPHELKDFEFKYEEGTIFLEDNFDLKNSKKKDIKNSILKWGTHVFNILYFGGLLVRGNHEKMKFFPKSIVDKFKIEKEIPVWIIVDGVLFTHGWKLQKKWELKEESYFDNDPKGAGFLRRIYVKTRNSARDLIDVKFTEEEKIYMLKFVKECQDIEYRNAIRNNRAAQIIRACCFGHCHPQIVIRFDFGMTEFVCVPRGLTEIEL